MFVLYSMVSFAEQIAQQIGAPVFLVLIALIWSLVWKALALWRAARKNHLLWFIAFFVIHTLGILEMLYYFLFSKLNLNKPIQKKKKK